MTRILHLRKAVPDTNPLVVLQAAVLTVRQMSPTVPASQKRISLLKALTEPLPLTAKRLLATETAVPLTALRAQTVLPPVQPMETPRVILPAGTLLPSRTI